MTMTIPRVVTQVSAFACLGAGTLALQYFTSLRIHEDVRRHELLVKHFPSLIVSLSKLVALNDEQGLRRTLSKVDELVEADCNRDDASSQWRMSRLSNESSLNVKRMCKSANGCRSDDAYAR